MIGILEILLLSGFAGLVGSTLGLGGALIITPVLVYFGVPIKEAIGASMVAIIATSSGSAWSYVKDGLSNIRAAFYLEIFTSVGAIVGAVITSLIAPVYLYFFFAAFLSLSFYGLRGGMDDSPKPGLTQDGLSRALGLQGSYYDKPRGSTISYRLTRPLLAAPGVFVAGLAAGMLGIGGGVFKTTVQELVMGMPSKVATATSNFMIGMTAVAGASIYFTAGLVNLDLAAPLAIGTTLGAVTGSRVLPRLRNRTLRILFFFVLLIVLIQMVYQGLTLL